MQLFKPMNIFKDQSGRQWICTPLMARKLRLSVATLHNHKQTGNLKRGIHWVQQTSGHRRIFFNEEAVRKWYGDFKLAQKEAFYVQDRKQQQAENSNETLIRTAKNKGPSVHVYLSEDAKNTIEQFAKENEVIVEERIAGELIARTSRVPSLSSVVNMLVLRAVADINAKNAA